MLILYRLHAYNYLLMLKNNVAYFFITVIIKNKPNYKGSYKPSWYNATLIQSNFQEFSKYINKTYKKLN